MSTELFEEVFDGCVCNQETCDTSQDSDCVCQKHGKCYSIGGYLKESALKSGNCSVVQECSLNCRCSKKCKNRVIQEGIKVKLKVFKHVYKGLGLKTLQDIKRGQFVCEYAGEVLLESEARRRIENMTETDMNYLFILREHFQSGTVCTYIDPQYKGNIGRFINHSCCPNLSIVPVRVDTMVPHVCLFASRDIAAEEEVTYDYGQHGCPSSDMSKRHPCKCGSEQCRGYLPFDANSL